MERSTAIVIGAASGIGKALAGLLSKRGFHLILVDKDPIRLAEVQSHLRGCESYTLDVTNSAGVEEMVQWVHSNHRIGMLVNSVGIAIAGEFRDASVSDLREAIEINLMGTLYSSLSVYRIMAAEGHGTILNIASGSGLFPLAARTHYTTTKFGVVGFTTALRQEAAARGVRVCVACPGVVKTPIFSQVRLIGPLDRRAIENRLARNRGLTPDQAAVRILRGVNMNKAIITLDSQVRLLWWLWKFSPRLYERFMARANAELERYRLA